MDELSPPAVAQQLFRPIAPSYERWARALSFGQDGRWRRLMVDELAVEPGQLVLDVAAGTGSITRLLQRHGARVVSLDQSLSMLGEAGDVTAVAATGEQLPFPDGSFDAVTFGYLLRYVDDVGDCLREVARVVRPGGGVGMVEFGRPGGVWGMGWWLYTRLGLPAAGGLIRSGWGRVGTFLGPSIDSFSRTHPLDRLADLWREAGIGDLRILRPSLGGGLVMVGRKS